MSFSQSIHTLLLISIIAILSIALSKPTSIQTIKAWDLPDFKQQFNRYFYPKHNPDYYRLNPNLSPQLKLAINNRSPSDNELQAALAQTILAYRSISLEGISDETELDRVDRDIAIALNCLAQSSEDMGSDLNFIRRHAFDNSQALAIYSQFKHKSVERPRQPLKNIMCRWS